MSPTGEIPGHQPYGPTRRTGGPGRNQKRGGRPKPAPTRRTQLPAEPKPPTTPRQRRIRMVAIVLIVIMILTVAAGLFAGVN